MKHFYLRIMGIILLLNLSLTTIKTTQSQTNEHDSFRVEQNQFTTQDENSGASVRILDSIMNQWPFKTPDIPPKYGNPENPENPIPPIWNQPKNHDAIHGIIVLLESNPRINDIPIQPGDFIGGFFLDENGNRKCGGLHVWDGSVNIGFPLFGNDNTTPEKDGFGFGELIELRFFSWITMKDYVIDDVGFSPGSISTNKWYPLGLSRIDDLKANVAFDVYIQPSENPACAGNLISLTAQEFVGTGGTYTYQWTSTPPGFQSAVQSPPPFTIQQATDYHLTVSDGVLVSEHTLTINVHQYPVAEAGSEGFVCADQGFQLSGIAENHSSIMWASDGDGTFNNDLIPDAVYTPGTMDVEAGEVNLILTAFPFSPCQIAATDTLKLYVSGVPSIAMEESVLACSSEPLFFEAEVMHYSSLEWTTTGSGTFSAPNEPVTQYFGSSNDINYGAIIKLCATPVSPCTVVSCSSFQLTYIAGPSVNTPNSRTRCENQTVSVNGVAYNYSATEWITSGDGTFANPNVFSTIYYPGADDRASGGVSLTLVAYSLTNCPPASKTIAVTLVKLPEVVSFGAAADHICNGDDFMQLDAAIQNHNGFSWSTNGDGTFNSTSILNPKYYPGSQDVQNGEFELVLTAAPVSPCNIATIETNLVAYQNNPTAHAGQDATIGQDQVFTAYGASATDYGALNWSTSGNGSFDDNTLLTTTYTPSQNDLASQPILLSLTAIPVDPCTVAATDDLLLSFNFTGCLNAIANAGNDFNFCENEVTSVQIQDAFAANYEYLTWSSSGDGYFDYPDQVNPIYILGAQDMNATEIILTLFAQGVDDCESANDDVKIIMHQNPVAAAGDDFTLCSDDATQLSGYAENFEHVFWTTSGDGTFDGQSLLAASYFPGTADATAGTVSICLQVTGTSYCQPAEDCVELVLISPPSANAGPDAAINSGQSFSPTGASVTNTAAVSWSSSGDGTFDDPNQLYPTYYHGQSDYLSMTVTLHVHAEPLQPCQVAASDFLELTIVPDCPEIVADAGSDFSLCADETFVDLQGNAPGHETVLWTTSGDGTFADEESIVTNYIPGQNDLATGQVVLTLIPFGAPPCPAGESDDVTITFVQPLTLTITNDYFSICELTPVPLSATASNYSSILWTTTGDGTFSENNVLNPVYTPGTNDLTEGEVSLTISVYPVSPCTEILQGEVYVSITGNAFADAGNDQSICEENTVQLSGSAGNFNSIYWATSGDGEFTNAQQPATTYIPGAGDIANGDVVLTLTAEPLSPCTTIASDEVMLFITRNPVCYTDMDLDICAGEAAAISGTAFNYSSINWVSTGSGTFENSQSLNTTYFPSSSDVNIGFVNLTLLANPVSPCFTVAYDEMAINIFQQPDAFAGSNQTICVGEPLQLNGIASNFDALSWTTSGDGTFTSTTVLNPVYSPGSADMTNQQFELCLTATGNEACDEAAHCIQVAIQQQPSAFAGPDNTVTFGDLFFTGAAQAQFADGVEWSTPDGGGSFGNQFALETSYTPTAGDLSAGQIVLVLTAQPISPCNIADADEMTLNIIEGCEDPTAFAGADKQICIQNPTIVLLDDALAENYASLVWSSDGDGTFSGSGMLNPEYYPGTEDLMNGLVDLHLKAFAFGDCNNTTDELTISFQQPPAANAGDDLILCEDDIANLQGSASNYASVLWETSGDGFFDDNTSLAPTYHPGTLDIDAGYIMLSLTALGIEPCHATTDELFITINRNPEAEAGMNQTICSGESVQLSGEASNYEALSWSTSGDGIFSSANSLNTVYVPGTGDQANLAVELCLTAIGVEGCDNSTHCLLVAIQPQPDAYAGIDKTIVFGTTYFTSDALVQNTEDFEWDTPDGLGSFTDPGTLSTAYVPHEEDAFRGYVNLEIAAFPINPCTVVASDAMLLTILPNCIDPEVNAGSDKTVCIEENMTVSLGDAEAQNHASLQWTTHGDGTFSQADELHTDYIPGAADLAAGFVEVCLKAFALGICEDTEDCLTITFQQPPLVSAGIDLTVCEDAAAQLQGEAQYFESVLWTTSGDGSFENPGSLSATYYPGNGDIDAGVVELSLQAAGLENCEIIFDGMMLTIASPPEVDAGDDFTICNTSGEISLSALAVHYSTIQWSTDGSGTFANENSPQATYYPSTSDILTGAVQFCVTATGDESCQPATDCLTATFRETPDVSLSGDAVICASGSASLSGSVEQAAGFQWSSSGSGTFSDPESLEPVYYPSALDASAGSVEICLTGFGLSDCEAAEACMTIEIQNTPIADAGADATIEQGDFFTTVDATAQNYSAIFWTTTGSGYFDDSTLLVTSYHPSNEDILSGSIILSLTSVAIEPCFTTHSDELMLTINYSGCFDAEANAGENITICEDSNVQLSGWADNYTTILWTSSGDGYFDDPTQPEAVYYPGSADLESLSAKLYLKAFAAGNCLNATDSLDVAIQPLPVAYAGDNNTAPLSQPYTFQQAFAENFASIQWATTNGLGFLQNDNQTNPTYYAAPYDLGQNLQFLMAVSAINPCLISADTIVTLKIIAECEDAFADAGDDITVCISDEITAVSLENAIAASFESILWTTDGDGTFDFPNRTNPEYYPGINDMTSENIVLTMQVNGFDGCTSASDQLQILRLDAPMVFAGDDQTICGSEPIQLNSTAENYIALNWSTSGDGWFDDPANLNTMYNPGTVDLQNGETTLCLEVEGAGQCGAAIHCFDVTFVPVPIVDAGGSGVVCEGDAFLLNPQVSNASSVLWTTSGDGTFSDNALPDATYHPGAGDMSNGFAQLQLSAFAGFGCDEVNDDFILDIIKLPQVDAGQNATIEQGENFTMTFASAKYHTIAEWSTSGDGTFNDVNLINATYYPGTNDLDALSVILTLTANPVAPCTDSGIDFMVLTIEEVCSDAEASAGEDVSFCDPEMIPLEGTAQNHAAILWETNGDGTFDNPENLTTTYYPGTTDLSSGTTILQLTAFAFEDCQNASDNLTLTYFASPVVFAGEDQFVCATEGFAHILGQAQNYASVLWTSGSGGNFFNKNSLSTTYIINATDRANGFVDLVLTANSDDCGSVSDTLQLSIHPFPAVFAGDDATICGNEQFETYGFVSDAESFEWSTAGDGTFDDASLLLATYFPGADDIQTGSAELCLTAFAFQGCEDDFACVTLTLIPSAFANAGSDQTICAGDEIQLSGQAADFESVVWETSGDGTFEEASSLNTIYYPGQQDVAQNGVELQLTAFSSENCGDAVSQTLITIVDNPTADAGTDQTICENNEVPLSGIATHFTSVVWTTTGDGTFANPDLLTTSYFPGNGDIQNGYAELCLTAENDGTCQAVDDCLMVTIHTLPEVLAGDDQTVCETDVVALSGFAETYSTILWSTSGDGSFSNPGNLESVYAPGAADLASGEVTICITVTPDGVCDAISDCLQIVFIEAPAIDAGQDMTICETSTALLQAEGSNFDFINWTTTGDGSFSNPTAATTEYTPGANDRSNGVVEITVAAGADEYCDDTFDAISLALQTEPLIAMAENILICEGETAAVSAEVLHAALVTWTSYGDGTFEDASAISTVYYPGSDDIAAGSTQLCLSATGLYGCDAVSECVLLQVQHLPSVIAGDNMTICESGEVELTALADNYSALSWSTSGDGTFTQPYAETGTYMPGSGDIATGEFQLCITATGLNDCGFATDCFTVSILNLPEAFAGEDITACEGESIDLGGSVANAAGHMWNSSGDGTFSNPESLSPVYYPGPQDNTILEVQLTLTAFGNGDCQSAADQLTIAIQPLPTAIAGDDIAICSGQNVQLAGNALNHSSVFWMTSGTGNFSNQHLLNPLYMPGLQDISNGGVTLYLRANGLNGCSYVIDTLQIDIHTPPVVDAGNDQTICSSESAQLDGVATDYAAIQWLTGGDGSFDDATVLDPIYFPGQQDIAAGAVVLQLSAAGLTPCSNTEDNLTVYIFDSPQITPLADIVSCEAAPVDLSATAVNYQSLQWQTSGDGTFDDDQSLDGIYYPGTVDLQNQSVNICLTATGFGMCEPAESCFIISFIMNPQVDAGSDGTVMQGSSFLLDQAVASNYSTLLWETSGTGTFGDATAPVTSYSPSDLDVATGEIVISLKAFPMGGCTDVAIDQLLLTVYQTSCIDAEVFAGSDQTVCATDSIHLDGATEMFTTSLLWSTSGDGTFDDATMLHPVYTPGSQDKAAGIVTVVLTGFAEELCNDDMHSLEITLQPLPVAYAGSDNTIPKYFTYTVADAWAENFTDIEWFSTNGIGDFEDPNIINPTYIPSPIDWLQGFVILQMSISPVNPCEATASSSVVISFDADCNDAFADAGEDMAICSNVTTIQLNGTASNFSSLLWTTTGDGYFDYPNTAAPKYIPGMNDRYADSIKIYFYAEAYDECLPALDSLIISPLVTPFVIAGEDQTLCGDEPAIIEDAWASGFSLLEWTSSGDGTFSEINTLETVYTPGNQDRANQIATLTLTASSPEPCQVAVSSELQLTLLASPDILMDVEDQQTLYGDIALFTVVSIQATNFQWYGPDGLMPGKIFPILVLSGVTFDDAGSYYCVLSNSCGETYSNVVALTVYEQQVINIPKGWSGVSSYIKPHNLSMDHIFSDYANDFLLIKNFNGVYCPAIPMTSLSLWNSNSGYEANFINSVEFVVKGLVNTNRDVDMNTGWNYLPVISPCEVDIETLFGSKLQFVELIKDIAGTCIYWPQHGINTIGTLKPGRSYFIKLNQHLTISYDECQQTKSGTTDYILRPENNTVWNDLIYSPASHTIAIEPQLAASLNHGDIIGAFTPDGLMAGYTELSGGKNVLTVFGDDPLTDEREGFAADESFYFRVYRPATGLEYGLEVAFDKSYPHFEGGFIHHGISGITLNGETNPLVESLVESMVTVYPNPTTGKLHLNGTPANAVVEIWSADGQKLQDFNTYNTKPDETGVLDFDLSGYSRGVYFIRIYSEQATTLKKVVLR